MASKQEAETKITQEAVMERSGILEVGVVRGKTAVLRSFCRYPLRFLQPSKVTASSDVDVAWVYVVNFGGGLVAGDVIPMQVTVGENATLALASQASTKVFRSPSLSSARQLLFASIAPGALLALLPEPIVCFRHARYKQQQAFHVAPGGSLALVDWITSGRRDSGEVWEMSEYESEMRVFRGGPSHSAGRGIPALMDTLRLASSDASLSLKDQMQGIHAMATIVLLGPRTASVRHHLQSSISSSSSSMMEARKLSVLKSIADSRSPTGTTNSAALAPDASAACRLHAPVALMSCSTMGQNDLLVARVASSDSSAIYHFLSTALSPLHAQLGHDPYRQL